MDEADRETAERHQAIWEEFHRRPLVWASTGRLTLPAEVCATVGFVIPVDDAAVRQPLQKVVSRLEATGCVYPFPPDYWHITVVPPALLTGGDATPPRLLPASFVEQALEKARKTVCGLGPFDLAVRGLNAFRDVLVAVPYDGGRGLELGRVLRSAIPELPERYHSGHDPVPHISLARYAHGDRLETLAGLLEGERETPFGRFRVERLEMFVLPVHDGEPGPVTKHEIPLGRP